MTTSTTTASDVLVSSVVLEFLANGYESLATKIAADYTDIDLNSLKSDIQGFDDVYRDEYRIFWTTTMTLQQVKSCVMAHFDTVTDTDYDSLFAPQVQMIIQRSERSTKVNAVLYR